MHQVPRLRGGLPHTCITMPFLPKKAAPSTVIVEDDETVPAA